MGWRIIVVTKRAKISYSLGYMVIRGMETHKVFMDEIETVMVDSTAVSLTAAWLHECMKRKIKVIFCDEKRNPEGELLSYAGTVDASCCLRTQIHWNLADKRSIWQSIVMDKIHKQADVLGNHGKQRESELLKTYETQVEPGDDTNREGFAAKVYFGALWGNTFSRNNECAVNGAMNYGYAILLSACNREIVSTGYSTKLGIFHDNTYNPFNLGCDLMESFRPLVDEVVMELKPKIVGKEEKERLINILNDKVYIAQKERTVMQAIGIYCRSVIHAVNEGKPELIKRYEMIHGK